MNALQKRFSPTPHVGDIRGRGLFVAIELVEDRETNQPFAPSKKIAEKVRMKALEEGLICYPSSGTIDGINGDHVLLSPPYVVTQSEIDEMVEKLEITFKKLGLC